jgi:hypothetical protein
MKEAVCATNFIKGLCRIFPSCNEREGKEEGEGETEGKREGEKEGEGERNF